MSSHFSTIRRIARTHNLDPEIPNAKFLATPEVGKIQEIVVKNFSGGILVVEPESTSSPIAIAGFSPPRFRGFRSADVWVEGAALVVDCNMGANHITLSPFELVIGVPRVIRVQLTKGWYSWATVGDVEVAKGNAARMVRLTLN